MPHTSFELPAEETSILQDIGKGLRVGGAGIAGRSQEALAAEEGRTQRLSLDRQRRAATDLQRARLLLDEGDLVGVRDLASVRIQAIQELGGDPRDTMGLLNLAESAIGGDRASLARLNTEIDEGLRSAAESGVISLPTPLSPEGKLEADIRAGLIERPAPPETARDQRISEIMATFDLDRPTAIAVIDNKIEIIQGTAPGEFSLVSSIPGFEIDQILEERDEEPVQIPQAARQEIAQVERGVDITGGIDVIEEATGPFDFLAAVAERVPILSELFEGGDERQAGLVFETLAKDFQRAFANNPRFAQTELQQITEKIVPATGPLSTASALQSDLIAVRRTMQLRVENAARGAANPNLQARLREADRSIVENGRNLIRSITQILDAHGRATAPTITTPQEFEDLPDGAFYRQSDGQLFRKQ